MENVESFYPLSPMQQGMLFHSLFDPDAGLYIEILSAALTGNLDVGSFQKTWQTVLDRHSILRTAFIVDNVKEPVQVVYKQINIPFDYQDWRNLVQEEKSTALEAYLKSQRQQGFKLSQAPLIRVGLLQTSDQEYQLVVVHHHILLDGWSIPLLLREILIIYTSLTMGVFQTSELEAVLPPTRPYRDYIVWLKQRDLRDSEAYWKRKLAGFIAPTPIPVTDLVPKDLSKVPEFSDMERSLSLETSSGLRKLARQQQVTLNSIFQAAWAILLSRYSGEEDVLFGVTVSGRPTDLPGSENMIGLFINTLPLRVQTPADLQFSSWIKQIHTEQAEMRQYEYTPLVQIQGWSDIPRGTSLFESLFVFENLPVSEMDSARGGMFDIQMGSSVSYTNFPITVVIDPDNEIGIKLSYSKQLFDPLTIDRMLSHLETILEGIITNPDTPLARIPMLSEKERNILLNEWNMPVKPVGTPASSVSNLIHEIFEKQVEQTPQAIALTFEEKHITYAELNQRSNQLAHFLCSLGVGPESLVGIYMERCPDIVVAILAVLKAGGAYVPLDPIYPSDRLGFIIDDYSRAMLESSSSQAMNNEKYNSVLLTHQSMLTNLPQTSAKVVCLDADWGEILEYNNRNQTTGSSHPESGVQPDNLAYVIYTSGSTGKPKGCMVTHRNVVRLFEATDHWYHFDNHDVWTLFHSYAFDFSVWEIWGALFYGGRLVIVPYFISRSPDSFYELLHTEGVTVLNQTPSAFRQLIRAEENLIEQYGAYSGNELSLRYVIFGGEALELQSLKPWFDRHGDQKPLLINMYGITETTVHVTYRPIYLKDLDEAPGSVIGKAIPDLRVFILDKNLEPVPIGVPGELFVGGGGVARGYLNRPELTSQRFLSGMFNLPPDEKVYRSGDLARYLPDGDIEYLGRIDHQVKIRGFRIELGEIESMLVQVPGVQEAVVLVRDDAGHKRLVAFLVPKAKKELIGTPPDEDERQLAASRTGKAGLSVQDIRQKLAQKLPDYMIPASFLLMESFPLTANGKINRQALLNMALPEEGILGNEKEFLEPTTDEEKRMAEIWKELLRVERISLNDNFFELGGDSILSIQLISRAKKAGFHLSYVQLFENPVLGDLLKSKSSVETREEEKVKIIGQFPLTPIQNWFFEQHPLTPEHFNTSIMLSVWEGINLDLLKRALMVMLRHHDQLRASFRKIEIKESVDGKQNSRWEWVQSIDAEELDAPFSTIDLANFEGGEQRKAIESHAAQIQASFHLDDPPLIRLVYFNLGKNKPGRLLFVFHHLITDGVSMRIFMEDYLTAYTQLMAGIEPTLPEKTFSYKGWSEKLHAYGVSDEIQKEVDYWKPYVGLPFLELPVDMPGGENTYGVTNEITLLLDSELTDILLHKVPVYYGCRVYDVLLFTLGLTLGIAAKNHVADATVMHGLDDQIPRVLVELEGHGREEVTGSVLEGIDLSRTIGWFTSIFPFYMDIKFDTFLRNGAELDDSNLMPSRILKESLQNVSRQLLSVPNRGLGYGVLRYLASNEIQEIVKGLAHPEVNFNYLGQFDQSGVELPPKAADSQDIRVKTPHMSIMELAQESSGMEQNPQGQRSAKLYFVAIVNGGQLGVRWLYSSKLHRESTIQQWAEIFMHELEKIIRGAL